ncbi:class I SAM-dependent methyltransferase [Floridanema evergladense]|uniref:Class I SAM-dependent methyltransferase n=1 Tax=Floridaenema evergladense BLCC-F167 TaxID=3153639 RepID=A0ABV4WQI0_9CYAN
MNNEQPINTDSPKDWNRETQVSWNTNASVWDAKMGDDGNDFHRLLVRLATEKLLEVKEGDRILDIGCGNGIFSRRLASLGAKVVGIDFSEQLIACAVERTQVQDAIAYHVIDATDETALLSLGENSFDAAISAMALMDMAEIAPLFRALTKLLKPQGCFVFSVMHPCFNNPHISMVAEETESDGEIKTDYSIKVSKYLQPTITYGLALRNQPKPHLYFHRPIHLLLGEAFRVGFVLNGLEEPAFPANYPNDYLLVWGSNFSEIPPVLVVRLKLLA